ncbi:MAG: carboxymuconolactone decarboxylase family protein [Gammaproteobacteria bacterium]
MNQFKVHTKETAPAESVESLTAAETAFGFIPNLLGILAESPAALNTYLSTNQIFEQSAFSPVERQVVILSVSRVNECAYCVAAHSVIADNAQVPADVVDAIRKGQVIADDKLEVLRSFTTRVVEKRGWVSEEEVNDFLSAGYTRAQVLDVIVAVSLKTLSNYVNHIAGTPLDEAFASREWNKQ